MCDIHAKQRQRVKCSKRSTQQLHGKIAARLAALAPTTTTTTTTTTTQPQPPQPPQPQPQPQIKHKQQQQQEEEQEQEGKPANISNISSRRTYGWQNQERQAPQERNPPCCTATSARLNSEVLSPITILWKKRCK
jgi:small-conductance mechanosensitive channel